MGKGLSDNMNWELLEGGKRMSWKKGGGKIVG